MNVLMSVNSSFCGVVAAAFAAEEDLSLRRFFSIVVYLEVVSQNWVPTQFRTCPLDPKSGGYPTFGHSCLTTQTTTSIRDMASSSSSSSASAMEIESHDGFAASAAASASAAFVAGESHLGEYGGLGYQQLLDQVSPSLYNFGFGHFTRRRFLRPTGSKRSWSPASTTP